MAGDESLEQTAISSDLARPSAPAVAVEALALAETHVSVQGSIVRDATLRSDSPRVSAGPLPAQIGRYLVIRSIAAGGMGEVVEAFDPELDRRVALKLLKAGRGRDDSQARLLREAQAMARLSHPNVVQIHDVGVHDDRVFLAMELVVGETLTGWLATPRPWRAVVRVFVGAARGLAAAHRAGLVHRDFKPDNVLMGSDERPRVADFGLAREDRDALAEAARNPGEQALLADKLTATGVVMGTPMYMSPEQHLGLPAGPASDVFSFSVALFEALHGTRPFAGDTMPVLARNVTEGKIVTPTGGRAVPGWLDAAVRRGLVVDPASRYPDFERLIAAIDRDPARTRGRWLMGLGLVVGAGVAGAALQGGAQAQVCGGAPAAIAEVWGAEVEASLRERLAPAAASLVVDGVQRYADGWATMHGEACLAHQRGETSATLLDAGMRCLEERRQALAGALAVIADGDAATLAEAPMVVAKLPALAACADAEALRSEVPPPDDAAVAAAVVQLRHRLVRARVLADAGRLDQAQAEIVKIRGEAEALGYRPLIAAAWLAEGRVAMDMIGPPALAALEQAFVHATAAGDDAVAAEARARQLYVEGALAGQLAQALQGRVHAEALVTRLGGRGDLEALLANNIGVLLLLTGDAAGASERLNHAVALATKDARTDPLDLAGYLKNAAQVAVDDGERARLFDQAAEILARTLGPEHVMTLTLRLSQAADSVELERAAEHLAAIGGQFAADRGRYALCSLAYYHLGHTLDELGRAAEAAAAMARAAACLDAPIAAQEAEPMAAMRQLVSGQRRVFAGVESEAAIGDLTAAAAAYGAHAENYYMAWNLADARVGMARAQVALGRDEPARTLLEQAIAGLEAPVNTGDQLPRYLLARARVLLAELLLRDPAGDRGRAAGLIDAAASYYRGAGRAARAGELVALRSRLPGAG
ncbi:MAG: serine/threonine protein kinase [Nannocystis sp.]|uniref:serine/threonine-protein kinase n=1 Tax=Nannocystis sp. TaxID=1962667 RepID=UPI002423D410|nr:serine/threonine-protein kinase [Nannocystis sp.]MBK9757381.1 serine/threonine protein kinase [Nannocystis sp.]